MDFLRAAVVFTACFLAANCEPQCSKFAYEEQTLEKMIRTEIKCEQLNQNVQLAIGDIKDSFTKLENNVKNALKEIKSALDTNKAVRTSINDDRTSMKDAFDQQINENKNVVRNHEARIDGMLQDLQQFQTFIYNNISGLVNSPTIAFNARDVRDLSPSNGQTVVFKTTLVNEGQAYDNTTGIFTAPVSGLYSFSAQLCMTKKTYVTASIVVGSTVYGRGFVRDFDDNPCNSFGALAGMGKENTAKIQIYSHDGNFYENSHRLSYFSGFLVNEYEVN